jgi:hypothetical protein
VWAPTWTLAYLVSALDLRSLGLPGCAGGTTGGGGSGPWCLAWASVWARAYAASAAMLKGVGGQQLHDGATALLILSVVIGMTAPLALPR